MLFNSYEFLFAFLPVTLVVFWWLGRYGRKMALGWLTLASLTFYGWQTPRFLILLGFSLVGNYVVSEMIGRSREKSLLRRSWMLLGVAVNLGFIGYFKYAGFLVQNWNALTGGQLMFASVVLPIGISFYTFQQIAYLVDRYRNEIDGYSFLDYCLFVTFFPQLIAGPIVHPKEMLPQFGDADAFRPNGENIAIGLSIFFMGLFKKTVIADGLILMSASTFAAAQSGPPPGFFDAWCAALAYTFQLYFDFSGYSDMAIGLGRLVGIRLPLNFDSPYKATGIIDFWRRWHMTLSRFLRDYIYFPLGGGRCSTVRRYTNLMITMLLGGLWHGAGWTFVLWGGLHGGLLIVNHAWNALKEQTGISQWATRFWHVPLARSLTFLAVVCGWVLFRSTSLDGATTMFQSMIGLNGCTLPVKWLNGIENSFGLMSLLQQWGVQFADMQSLRGRDDVIHLLVLLAVVWFAPNTQQIMADWQPAYEKISEESRAARPAWLGWQPSTRWAITMSFVTVIAILELSRASEFLYFQF